MLVKITNEHIAKSVFGDIDKCPLALAIRELLPDKTVRVGAFSIYIGDKTEFLLGPGIFDIVKNYDLEKGMKPFEFELPYEN